jgi:hypothetical protein
MSVTVFRRRFARFSLSLLSGFFAGATGVVTACTSPAPIQLQEKSAQFKTHVSFRSFKGEWQCTPPKIIILLPDRLTAA